MRISDWSSDVCASDLRRGRHRGRHRRRGLFGAFDEAVEFAAVQPDAAALRAVVDLDALAIGHGEVHVVAGGTLHWLLRSMDGEPPSLPFGWRIGMRCGVRWWQGKAAARRRGRIASGGGHFAIAAKVLTTGRWPADAPGPQIRRAQWRESVCKDGVIQGVGEALNKQ